MRKVMKFLQLAVLLTLLFGASSCKTDGAVALTVSTEALTVDKGQGVITFTVNCEGSWKITGVPTWCSVSPSQGTGTGTVTITVLSENTTSAPRTGAITINGGKSPVTVKLTQPVVTASVDPKQHEFTAQGTPLKMTVTSNTDWSFSKPAAAEWCEISPMSGSGNATVTLTPKPITDRVKRDKVIIRLMYADQATQFIVSQQLPNNAPTAASLLLPADAAVNQTVLPVFSWSASTDADGDELSYELFLSKDQTNWDSQAVTTKTSARVTSALSKDTKYYWKVVVKDGAGGEVTSAVRNFTTGSLGAYSNAEARVYQSHTSGKKQVNLVVTGDGFIESDYIDGGNFDKVADEAIEAFLGVEPYSSYRDYFKVQKVAAFSAEQGATIGTSTKSTIFKSKLEGGGSTGISCDYDLVFDYAKRNTGLTDDDLNNMTVLVIINVNAYAGTCLSMSSGRSVSMVPVTRGSSNMTTFGNVVSHEAGGHGFGRLSDEYENSNMAIPEAEKTSILQWESYGFGANITVNGDRNSVKWKHFFTQPGYSAVGMFEGAGYYKIGVWRPESKSCMIDNRLYYNAPSREAIVKRIKAVAGEAWSQSDFYSKDVVKSSSGAASKALFDAKPLGKPIYIINN